MSLGLGHTGKRLVSNNPGNPALQQKNVCVFPNWLAGGKKILASVIRQVGVPCKLLRETHE